MSKITRRSLLAAAAATAAAGKAGAGIFTRGGQTAAGGGLPALTATITFPGGTPGGGPFVFDIATGTDMGSYTNPSNTFTQRCIRSRNAGLPSFFVDFRPDTAGGRIEVVFWYGEVFGSVANGHIATDLATYTAVVKNAGTPVADFMSVSTRTIPYHRQGARWRFRTTQNRTILRTASQVFSEGWLPKMTQTAAKLAGTNTSTGKAWSGLAYSNVASGGSLIVPPTPPVLDSSNMGTIGASTPFNTGPNGPIYEPFMQATGGGLIVGALAGQDAGGKKFEEGMISEWVADYLLNANPDSLNTILQQAELCGSQMNSWYLPDNGTGACPYAKQDLTHYKSGSGNPAGFPSGAWVTIPADATPSANTIQASGADGHSETWFYIPYVLTEDPFFIEGIQYQQMYGVFYDAPGRYGDSSARANIGNVVNDATGATGLNGPFTVWSYPAECRNLGWGTKNVAHAWLMSPTSPPSWLLPKSAYAAYSSDYSVCGKKLILDSTDGMNSVFNYYMIMGPQALAAPQAGPAPVADFYQNFEQCYTTMAQAFAQFISLPVPTVAGQITPPSWGTHAAFSLGMMNSQFIATNPTDQFSIAGWNRQCPLIHDLAGPQLSDKFGNNAGSGIGENCPTSTSTSDNILTFFGYHCLHPSNTFAAMWALYGPALTGLATFPSAAFPGNQQDASMQNVNWQMAAAAVCKSAGVDTTNATALMAFFLNFIDYNWPNTADANLGISMYMRAGFDGT
jgi:hypothetical protein